MLRTWTLEHFKSVYDRTQLQLAPLTIFAGANSSGKSTLIQSLLLTAQTLQSRLSTRSAVLNGHILRLGAVDDIRSRTCDGDTITIGFALDAQELLERGGDPPYYYYGPPLPARTSVACEFTLSAGTQERGDQSLQLQPRLESTVLTVTAPADAGGTTSARVHLVRSRDGIAARRHALALSATRDYRNVLPALEYEVLAPALYELPQRPFRAPVASTAVGAAVDHFLPASLAVRYDAIEEEAATLVQHLSQYTIHRRDIAPDAPIPPRLSQAFLAIIDDRARSLPDRDQARAGAAVEALKTNLTWAGLQQFYQGTPASLDRLLSQALAEEQEQLRTAARDDRARDFTLGYSPLPDLCEAGRQLVRRYFTQYVRYLGPLREEPKPIFPLAGAAETKDVGFSGENTAAVLHQNRDAMIAYVPSAACADGASHGAQRGTLKTAVLDWLDYMGVAADVATDDLGKLGHVLKISPSGSNALSDLTHVGVGVSQVLPILVLCLLAEPGSTLVLEQPELHLHPRVQTRLADFFLSLTYLGKQCLVETHSEYLINRLRLQAVRATSSTVADAVCVYFVEAAHGRSQYRHVRIDEYGAIGDWPRGFFDESESIAEAILRAAMEKRAKAKGHA